MNGSFMLGAYVGFFAGVMTAFAIFLGVIYLAERETLRAALLREKP